ncbi:MAG: sporulation protein YqfD [Eubacteriales bacterium]|nr:sporulation protein YqfD [Eubacteriales bacterium]
MGRADEGKGRERQMGDPGRLLQGYVILLLEGGQLERFLNLCRGRAILLGKITITEAGRMTAIVSLRDFFRLGPIRRKTGVHIHILKKCGFPFFLQRSKRRKAFLLGSLLCLLLLFFLSGRLWSIRIQGNVSASTPELMGFLTDRGITHGISKKSISCSEIAAMVREEYPAVTWASARLEGTRLILSIREGKAEMEKRQQEGRGSLAAEVGGEIVSMVTRAGTPAKRTGEWCSPGEILIAGWVDIKNDSQEVVRREYLAADGDVYVRRSLPYEESFSRTQRRRVLEEGERRRFSLQLGSWYFSLAGRKREGDCRRTELFPLRLTESFVLPITLGRITDTPQRVETVFLTPEESRELALLRLRLYEEKLMKKGVQISGNDVKIEVDDARCVSRGALTVIEKTGRLVPSAEEVPTERILQDG